MKPGIVITVYNEARTGWRQRERDANGSPCGPFTFEDSYSKKYDGNELLATLDNVRTNAGAAPIVVVDDGSDDGCCDRAGEFWVDLVRHDKRIGIGYSRTEGVEHLPKDCDAVMFLDAHQRVSVDCVEFCAELALKQEAIVWPDVRGLRDRDRFKRLKKGQRQEVATQHGARARTIPRGDERGYLFRNSLIFDKPPSNLSRSHAFNSPGYTLPMSVWEQMPISKLTRGFGANEPMLWVKAFFLDVPILHTCDAMVRHLFRSHDAHYTATPHEVDRNMAILAKTCFDPETWDRWWFPHVFKDKLTSEALETLNSPALLSEHRSFQARKRRSDREFWRGLCLEPVPDARSVEMAEAEMDKRAARRAKHARLKAAGRLVSQHEERARKLGKRADRKARGKLATGDTELERKLKKRADLKAQGRLASQQVDRARKLAKRKDRMARGRLVSQRGDK